MGIYIVEASPCKYEQYERAIVQASNYKEALKLAKSEFESAKDWVIPWINQKYKVSFSIDSKVIMDN
ncbi:hypothetical protein [Limosilactobacillus urinaemulieris]|uniref:hypothetical protein n=1 Tax=Limosilactobacillus urinaemulieris TaxID=2742600 RepID=UPI0028E98AE2|nr:hypothetical protein [Limosilactobacillus urinaemulieris]